MASTGWTRLATWIAVSALLSITAGVIFVVGQPIRTADLWWHLFMGERYLAEGPWLSTDLLLHTAVNPPAPAAWLADVGLHGVLMAGGFTGLRILHVAIVIAIIAIAYALLRRTRASVAVASLFTACFVVLSMYRVIQLRPALLSILGALVIYRLVIAPRDGPSRAQMGMGVATMWLWANLHAGFLLAPILVAAAIGSIVGHALIRPMPITAAERRRVMHLSIVLVIGLAATLLNPSGADQHLAYFVAGSESPDLGLVLDEWARFSFTTLPAPTLPPSLLNWGLTIALCAATLIVTLLWLRRQRAGQTADDPERVGVDPALLGLAWVGIALMILAIRFSWMGLFPLLLLAASLNDALAPKHRVRVALACAATSLALVPAFVEAGDWALMAHSVPSSVRAYEEPYLTGKFNTHTVWLLADAGLEGNLFNEYSSGNFIGYWLAPKLKTFVNGSLNFPPEVLVANRAFRERRGRSPDESFTELLDLYEIDLFIGIQLPTRPIESRPWIYTTTHLENTPGWVCIFRNLTSAIYLRDNERNQTNFERIATYYAKEGIDFDRERGIDVEDAIRTAPHWAYSFGVIPMNLAQLIDGGHGFDRSQRLLAHQRLSTLYAALGLYDHAIRSARRVLRDEPGHVASQKTIVWSLLKSGQFEEAREEAEVLEAMPGINPMSRMIADAAVRHAREEDPGRAAAMIARLPLLTQAEGNRGMLGIPRAAARATLPDR